MQITPEGKIEHTYKFASTYDCRSYQVIGLLDGGIALSGYYETLIEENFFIIKLDKDLNYCGNLDLTEITIEPEDITN